MNVEVGYELDEEATKDVFLCLRAGARALTDDAGSIRIERGREGERHVVIVTFTMRTMAQYKVVGDISHRFKLSFACHHEYRDCWIRFPR